MPIYLRITYNQERKNLSTGFSILPERWDKGKCMVKGTKEDAVQINAYINQTTVTLMESFNKMLKERDVNLDVLIDRFLGRDVNNMTLLELVRAHNDDFKARIGTDYAYSTFEKYDLRVKTPSGKTINLILEISGFSQDKDYKTNYVYNRWLPAVNNIREKYEMDEWHFLEVSAEIRDIKAEIREALKKADQKVAVSVNVQ